MDNKKTIRFRKVAKAKSHIRRHYDIHLYTRNIFNEYLGLNSCFKYQETKKYTEIEPAFFFLNGLFGKPNYYHDTEKEYCSYLFESTSNEYKGLEVEINISTIVRANLFLSEEISKLLRKEVFDCVYDFVEKVKQYSIEKYGKPTIPMCFLRYTAYDIIRDKEDYYPFKSFKDKNENFEILCNICKEYISEKNLIKEGLSQEEIDKTLGSIFWSIEFEEYTREKFKTLFFECFGYSSDIMPFMLDSIYNSDISYKKRKKQCLKTCQFFYDNADKYPTIAKIYKFVWAFGEFIWNKELTIRDCSYNIQGRIIK